MTAIGQGQSVGCGNPLLTIVIQQNGLLADPSELNFAIFDISTPVKQQTPVQVYPLVADTTEPVNLADCPTGARLAKGVFAATWTHASNLLGYYLIRWSWKLSASDALYAFAEQTFEVLSGRPMSGVNDYAMVEDLRAEGVTVTDASDMRLLGLINMASRYIEKVTRRFFNPRLMTFDLEGPGHGILILDQPVIGISEIRITIEGISFSDQPIDLTDVAVYNRHLAGLLAPDDRDNPKIAFKRADPEFARLHALLGRRIFYEGKKNIRVQGVFGYTEANGQPAGMVPPLINFACKLLVLRNLPKLSNTDARIERLDAGNVRRMRTRDQEIEYQARNIDGSGATQGPITGDNEVDSILIGYSKGPDIRVV